MGFQKGNKFGKGRPKSKRRQVADWVKEHPYAVAELYQTLYEKGIKGDRESAMYIIDRIKGKPMQQTKVELEGGEMLGAGVVIELLKIVREEQMKLLSGEYRGVVAPLYELKEGRTNGLQGQGETEGI